MAENLQRAGGFVHAEAVTMALAQAMGRPAAKALMERLCADALGRGCPLPQAIDEAARQDARLAAALPEAERRRLFDAQTQLGDAGSMIDRALRDWRDPIAVHSFATPPAPPSA
jgi:3-carboxy-cis,cis-muconate cycloisomerase